MRRAEPNINKGKDKKVNHGRMIKELKKEKMQPTGISSSTLPSDPKSDVKKFLKKDK